MTRWLPLLGMLFSLLAHAHNGKVAYAYACSAKKVDARADDWEAEKWNVMQGYFGQPVSAETDLQARFKIAYHLEESALYVLTEITDDRHTPEDFYEFYINGIHSKGAGGVASLIFRNKAMELRIHEEHKDPVHAQITKDDVQFQWSRKGRVQTIEIRMVLPQLLEDTKTIGIDHFIVDVDRKSGEKTYLNWGIGYNGFWKEFNSGQLGDIVLLPEPTALQQVSGMIRFEDQEELVQQTVRITHRESPGFWIEVPLDSVGNFEVALPPGNYYVSPSYALTHPFAGEGYGNQLRLDTHFQHPFSVRGSQPIPLGEIVLPVFKEPNYLFREEGVVLSPGDLDDQELDAFIKAQMTYYQVPGASVAVIKEGQVVYDKVFGYKSLLTKAPITKRTKFQGASVTKSVFAFIVNRLVDQRKFDLDVPLYTWLPFPNYENDPRYQKITGRMVLNHTTGMPNWAFGGPGGYASGMERKLDFEPGTQFGYSGEAFEYLARTVAAVTGKGINQLLQEEVMDALGIDPIYFVGNESLEFAQGHLQSNPTYWWPYATEPGVAHSMLTNASDFAQFLVALANHRGMSPAQYQAMFHREVLAPGYPTSPEFNYWDLGLGLGFFVQDTVIGKAVMHGGSNYDFQSEFVLYPELKHGFVIFTNSNTGHKLGQAVGKYLFYGGTTKQNPSPQQMRP